MPTPKYPADRSRSYADAEGEARRARQRLGFDAEEPLPSVLLFERVDQMKTGTDLNTATKYRVDDLLDGVEGETRYDRKDRLIEVVLSESTFENLESDQPRARFSLAHEIGHAVQHYEEITRRSKLPHYTAAALLRGQYNYLRPFEDVEWQADAFGAALLMPAQSLWKLECAGQLSVDEICRRFVVSTRAAAKRIQVFEARKEALVR